MARWIWRSFSDRDSLQVNKIVIRSSFRNFGFYFMLSVEFWSHWTTRITILMNHCYGLAIAWGTGDIVDPSSLLNHIPILRALWFMCNVWEIIQMIDFLNRSVTMVAKPSPVLRGNGRSHLSDQFSEKWSESRTDHRKWPALAISDYRFSVLTISQRTGHSGENRPFPLRTGGGFAENRPFGWELTAMKLVLICSKEKRGYFSNTGLGTYEGGYRETYLRG